MFSITVKTKYYLERRQSVTKSKTTHKTPFWYLTQYCIHIYHTINLNFIIFWPRELEIVGNRLQRPSSIHNDGNRPSRSRESNAIPIHKSDNYMQRNREIRTIFLIYNHITHANKTIVTLRYAKRHTCQNTRLHLFNDDNTNLLR